MRLAEMARVPAIRTHMSLGFKNGTGWITMDQSTPTTDTRNRIRPETCDETPPRPISRCSTPFSDPASAKSDDTGFFPYVVCPCYGTLGAM